MADGAGNSHESTLQLLTIQPQKRQDNETASTISMLDFSLCTEATVHSSPLCDQQPLVCGTSHYDQTGPANLNFLVLISRQQG